MHRDLKQYLCIKQSVIKIQAWYRCQLVRRIYQEHREKIVAIQRYYRAYKSGKIEREYYLQKRAAAIVLQAAFRCMKARKAYRQTKAVCVVQSLQPTGVIKHAKSLNLNIELLLKFRLLLEFMLQE
uniref:Myosin motor domain-containing protein n=1 Tax=Aquila chrysaetos chrysaetos TaxID=223781 RepID=A0A663EKC4_AQUCH